MAFQINADRQVHISISEHAAHIIENDMLFFHEGKKGTFLNTVLENYREPANASISIRMEEYKASLLETLSGLRQTAIDASVERLVATKKEELVRKMEELNSVKDITTNSVSLRLKDTVFTALAGRSDICDEDCFYKTTTGKPNAAKYLKTILEEYCRLPYLIREKVYFSDRFSMINQAIADAVQLRIVNEAQCTYHVVPWKIIDGPQVAYLAGYSYTDDKTKKDKVPCSFRISTIQAIKIEKSRSGFLSKEDISRLQKRLAEVGIQFMLADDISFQVRFTPDGEKMFARIINLRPVPLKKEGNVYSFCCSPIQARNYFHLFGGEAEILPNGNEEIDKLRDEFRRFYKRGAKVYS